MYSLHIVHYVKYSSEKAEIFNLKIEQTTTKTIVAYITYPLSPLGETQMCW